MKCGKQLPMAPPTTPGAPPMAPPAPPSPSHASDDVLETVFDRPLTDAERDSLKRVQRTGVAGVTKMLATLFGIAPLFLLFMAYMGTPFDPDAFPAVMVGAALLAVIMGAVCFKGRYPAGLAIARGTVREARGVPKKTARGLGQVAVKIGDVEFVTKVAAAESIQDGVLNAVAFIPPNVGGPGKAARPSAWIVGVNGNTLRQPVMCSVSPVQDLPPPPPPGAFMQGGK